MANLGKVIYINEEDYSTLLNGGSITKGGTTYTYDSTALYVIKDVSAPEYAETAGYATTAGQATKATQDGSGNVITATYDKKPLVIEVNDTDTTVPSGTYASITAALAAGRDVLLKVTLTEYDSQVEYLPLIADNPDNVEYYFANSEWGASFFDDNSCDISYSANKHVHGNITPNGQLQTNDITIASGDKLVVTDASNSSRIARASLSFDGSTTTQALTKKGTWETFYQKPSTGIPASDLTSAAQTSLGKADSSVQDVKVKVGTGTAVSIVDSNKVANVTLDTTPTANSTNTVTSGGIKTALDNKVDKVTSTDNAIARFDGTGGQIQNSGVTIDDSNNITVPAKIQVQGTNTTNTTRYITSDSANNIYASVGGVASLVVNNTEVRRGSSANSINLGSSSYPWNNAYAKKFITSGGTSSQVVLGDGTLKEADELPQNADRVSGYLGMSYSSADRSSGYINVHPESTSMFIIPYLYNDLAYLVERGGDITIYSTEDTDLTQDTLTVKTAWGSGSTFNNMFNASHNYYGFANTTAAEMYADGIIIDISLPYVAQYTNRFYIDFGNNAWKFKKIDVYVKHASYDTNYTNKVQEGSLDTYSAFYTYFSYSTINPDTQGSVVGFNRMRIHLYDKMNNVAGCRIAQIGLIRHSGNGIREAFMSRGVDDRVYRSISPYTNNKYDLGTSSYYWKDVYAYAFKKQGGTASQFLKANGSVDSTTYTPQTAAGANSLLSSLPDWTATPTDTTKLVRRDTGGGASFGQITFLTVWNYIKSKISSVLGIGGDNGVPTAPTAASGTNTTQIATTAFVQNAISNAGAGGSEMVDVTITGTTSAASFSTNPYTAIKAVVDEGKIAVLNASVAPISTTDVLIPVYEYTYSQSGTDFTGYKGSIQHGSYEIAVDVQSTSSATVTITEVSASVTVDSALSETSTNPVQNAVITAQILENEEIVATALNNLNDRVELKQDQLVSGTTIKTINGNSILGSGNITISGGSGGSGEENVIETVKVNGTALVPDANKAVDVQAITGVTVGNTALTPSNGVITIGIDSTPTANSTNVVLSGAVKTALDGKQDILEVDDYSDVDGGGIYIIDGALYVVYSSSDTDSDGYSFRSAVEYSSGGVTYVKIYPEGNISGQTLVGDLDYANFNGVRTTNDIDTWVGGIWKFEGGLLSTELPKGILIESSKSAMVSGRIILSYSQIFIGGDGTIRSRRQGSSTDFSEVDWETLYYTASEVDTLLSVKQDTLVSGTNIKTINSTSLLGSGDISVGTYSKPSGGIPATDLASAVQTSLGLADTALQSYTETDPVFTASAAYGITSTDISTWNGKYTKPSTGIPSTDLASAVTTSLGKADSAVQDIQAKIGTGTAVSIVDSSTKIATITIDASPTSGSTNTVTSGGVYTAINAKYTKPSAGIPETDLATAVSQRLLPSASGSTDDGKIVQYSYTGGGWQLVKPITTYTGSSAPSSSVGSDGDIYIVTS